MRPALNAFSQMTEASLGGRPQAASMEELLNTDEDYVSFVRRSYDDWYQARYAYEPGWWLCVAYYMGFQYHGWSEVERLLRETRAPSYRVRMVINKLMPWVKTTLGKLLRGDPTWKCRPSVTSDVGFSDARVGDRLLRGLFRTLEGRETFQWFLMWLLTTGHAFMKVGWDPTLGRSVDLPGVGSVQEGEISMEPLGPFSILIPPEQMTLAKPSSIIESRIYPLQWVRQVFGDRARDIKPETDATRMSNYEGRLATLVSPQGYLAVNAKAAITNGVLLIERHDDPQTLSEEERQKFPQGRVIIATRSRLLFKEGYPTGEKHPYVDCRAELCPGRYWGASLIDQLIPLQKSYNRGRSQIVEARNLTSNPVIDVEAGHGISSFSGAPGTVNERKKGWAAPQYRVPPQVGQHHLQSINQDLEDFQEITQQRETTKGQAPAANITGVAINLLQEADNTPLGPLAIRIASAIGKIGEKIIEQAQTNYLEPRIIPYVGDGQELEVMEFLGSAHQTKILVECTVDSILPESRAARLARVEEAIRMGALDPIRDRAAVIQLLEFGNVEQLYDEQDLDRQKQKREIKVMLSGMPVPIADFDNHDAHLMQLNRFRKTVEFERLDPEIQAIINQHADQHLLALMEHVQAAGAGMQPSTVMSNLPGAEPAPLTALGPIGGGGSAISE